MDEGAPRGLSSSPSGSLDLLGGGEPRPQDLGCWVGLSASLVKRPPCLPLSKSVLPNDPHGAELHEISSRVSLTATKLSAHLNPKLTQTAFLNEYGKGGPG